MVSPASKQKVSRYLEFQKIAVPIILSIIGTMIALYPSNPNNMTLPSRDSGVFLYVGWRFLNGDIPYKDMWDHKPPLIYIVNLLGLSLTPNSLWGIWILQAIFIFFTFFLLYKLLDKEFGILPALGGSIIFASGLLTILERGNVTEEFALLFQVLCFWLFISAWKKDFPIHTSFWIGLLGGLAFNFKQTTIGIWIVCGLILLALRLSQRKSPIVDFLTLIAGWLIPSVVIVIYFASQNALMDYWEQAFLYNFTYIGKHEGIRRLIPVFLKGFLYLQNGWVLYLSILGWLAGLVYVWQKRKKIFTEVHPLILVGLVNLPIEMILITISGRSILHYYLTLLPVMAILTGVLIYSTPVLSRRVPGFSNENAQRRISGIVLAAVVLAQFGQIRFYPEYVIALAGDEHIPVVEYVTKNTSKDDKVLIIGAESAINFLARREAPTRYVYQYPLALLGRRPMFEEYFNQILENKPVLIIDTRGRGSLTEKLYEPLQKRSEIVRNGVHYFGQNYRQVAQFGEWFVYRFIE